MTPPSAPRPAPLRAHPLGDSAIAIVFGTERSAELLHRIHSTARALEAAKIPHVEDVVPAYLALTVFYDSLRTSYVEMSAALLAACDRAPCLQHNLEFVHDVTSQSFDALLEQWRSQPRPASPLPAE